MRRPPAYVAAAAVLVVCFVLAGCGSSHSPPLQGATTRGPCAKPNPSNPVFDRTQANHLVDSTGRIMVPSGITVYGLALRNWEQQEATDRAQIRAAITRWCVSYVRLQVGQANLLDGAPYNKPYLARVESEVDLAQSYDANVVLSAQTERYSDQPSANPTEQTIRFWHVLAPLYRHDHRVWFDLFNEPRLKLAPSALWPAWRGGISLDGQRYVGMQQLVDSVRAAAGSSNLILVEGPNDSENFGKLPRYLIQGVNVAYAAHAYGETDERRWNDSFGSVAATQPVIVDEWGEWDRPNTAGSRECSPAAATWVPQFFAYLQQRQIGLGAWALVPGVLVTNTETFTPTSIGADYTCRISDQQDRTETIDQFENAVTPVPDAHGVGVLLQRYFTRQRQASTR